MRKIQLLPFALITVLACGYAFPSLAKAPEEVKCGLGPPPGSREFSGFEASQKREAQLLGYGLVCAGDLARYDVGSDLRPVATVISTLDFQPVNLGATPFNSFPILGAFAEAVSGVKSRLYRSFKTPDGHTVTLFEDDMSADETQSYRNPKDEPERVNEFPARLMVLQAPNGKAISVISWTESRRSYELWLDANVTLEKKNAAFIALAASIPKSTPARKDEPKLTPITVGTDGMPIMPAPPKYIQ